MGELTYFLGLQDKKTSTGLFVSQEKYTRELLVKYKFPNLKGKATPMANGVNLDTDEKGESVDQKQYSGIVGSLLYLTANRPVTERIDVVVNCTPIRVKRKSKLTSLMKITRIEGYNGKYGLNPEGTREISGDLFKFDEIGRRIIDRNWEKWYFMKENFKTIPWNKKSSNLTLLSRRN